MVLLDVSHTSHTRAQTGIQRVCRALAASVGDLAPTELITFDPYWRGWRRLDTVERVVFAYSGSSARRRAMWTGPQRWRGRVMRLLQRPPSPLPPANDGIIVPEIFSPTVAQHLPQLFRAGGPRVALFHDAIPLRLPEFTPAKTVARFPAYLQELRQFDGVAAVSEDSKAALVDYWRWSRVKSAPPVVALPLGITPLAAPRAAEQGAPLVLSVGSIEGRKNHLALFDACDDLWEEGLTFRLRVIGMPRPETAAAALTRLDELIRRGRPLTFAGSVSDAELVEAYGQSTLTVYPSLMEGFGLPVLESLAHGRPCICSSRGALGESAAGGGCLALDRVDRPALREAIRRLFNDPQLLRQLSDEARTRPLRTWRAYAGDLLTWMRTLPRPD